MLDLVSHPRLLEALRQAYRLGAVLRWRARPAKHMERERSRFYQEAWTTAAARSGASLEALGDEMYEIALGDLRIRVAGNCTSIDDPVTLLLAGNKPATFRLLERAGLCVPRHAAFSLERMQPALELLDRVQGPCVVKPAKATGGGLGVTTGITDRGQLARVSAFAAAYSRDLLIEEQIDGDNFRLLYLDGALLDAVIRRPPAVMGDGRSTIADLVRQENARRVARGRSLSQFLVHADSDMRRTLARQGLTLRSTPSADAKVVVKTAVNENSAEETESAADLLCEAIVDAGARAARAVGVRLAGVDVITRDPSRPLEESGGVIVEVNATPGLYYHYHKQGESFPVAEHLLRRLFDAATTEDASPLGHGSRMTIHDDWNKGQRE